MRTENLARLITMCTAQAPKRGEAHQEDLQQMFGESDSDNEQHKGEQGNSILFFFPIVVVHFQNCSVVTPFTVLLAGTVITRFTVPLGLPYLHPFPRYAPNRLFA